VQDIDVAAEAPETVAIIEKLRAALNARPFDSVWVSELRRTQQTAALLGYTSPSVSAALNELDFGPWEGRLARDLRAERGGAWLTDPQTIELGESFESFVSRVRAFTNRLTAEGHTSALVIGHGAWIRCCIALADHGDARLMNKVTLGNGELVERDLEPAGDGVAS
jgi:broad specificity phosphatase PhoE